MLPFLNHLFSHWSMPLIPGYQWRNICEFGLAFASHDVIDSLLVIIFLHSWVASRRRPFSYTKRLATIGTTSTTLRFRQVSCHRNFYQMLNRIFLSLR
jgi:hypothetical protein